MSNILVSNSTQLLQALKVAKSGDVVKLAPGNYGTVVLSGVNILGNVTIESGDSSHQATFNALQITGSSGLTFKSLDLAQVNAKDLPFQVLNSSRIVMDSLNIHGSLDGSSHDDGRGMIVRNSSNVVISNSTFSNLTDALTQLNNNDITIVGNKFNTIADNGVVGGGTSNLRITNNYFTDFDHVSSIHPDAIQLWTTNTTTSASNILISGNVFDRGSGAAVQGIFVHDEVGNLAFQNLTISNNTVAGGLYNGISVQGAKDVTINGNTVLGFSDQQSWIRAESVSGAVDISNNIASSYQIPDQNVSHQGNITLATPDATANSSLSLWVNGSATDGLANLSTAFSSHIQNTFGMSGYFDQPSTLNQRSALVFTPTIINGTDGADRLVAGLGGNYQINGGAGNDTLVGGSGGDHLNGGAGNDTLDSGVGQNVLSGGAGSDVFLFRPTAFSADVAGSAKTISDFSHAEGDHINLTMMDANSLTVANDTFKFIGTSSFDHTPGELRFQAENGGVLVSGDTNGDGVPDFLIHLTGVSSLAAGDFWL